MDRFGDGVVDDDFVRTVGILEERSVGEVGVVGCCRYCVLCCRWCCDVSTSSLLYDEDLASGDLPTAVVSLWTSFFLWC